MGFRFRDGLIPFHTEERGGGMGAGILRATVRSVAFVGLAFLALAYGLWRTFT